MNESKLCVRCKEELIAGVDRPIKEETVMVVPIRVDSRMYDHLMSRESGCMIYEADPTTRLVQVQYCTAIVGSC